MAAPQQPPAMKIRDLVVGFGPRIVLDHLSLDLRQGEVLGLVGASGSGKSVFLKAVLGLMPKQSGSISILGVDRDRATMDETRAMETRWGVLFQQGALFSSLTVRQNVEFPMREYFSLPDDLRGSVALTKLGMVGLTSEDADKFPSEISGGMTKRVALARALAVEPDVLFLDEPTSGLDPIAAREFDLLIDTLRRTMGLTVLMVTHDLDSLTSVCDRVAALCDGRIVASGSMETMLQSQHPWVQSYFRARRPHGSAAA